jgi:tetratricopeptide (TPR) repeat protein
VDPFAAIGPQDGAERSDPFARRDARSDDPFANRAALFGAPDPAPTPASSPTSSPPSLSSSASSSASADPFAQFQLGDDKPAASGTTRWVVRAGGSEQTLDIAELRERIKRGQVGPDDLAGPVGTPLKPVKDVALLAVSLQGRSDQPRVQGARAARSGADRLRPLALAAAAVVGVGVAGAGVYTVKPELFERRSEAGVNPLRQARPTWQRQFPDVEGTAQEHVNEGRRQMRLDTAAGYRKADDELRQALLLDVGNVAAIASWAENLANLPTVRADRESSALAFAGLEYALKLEPENVELLRAQGALLLGVGRVDDAQRVLNRALKLSPGDVDIQVQIAKSDVERNAAEALTRIQREVRARDPEHKLALTIEGGAQRRLGAYKEARELLNTRLAADPKNVGALREMARLELDLGHPDAALAALGTLLESEDKDVESHLMRARILYQVKGGPDGIRAAATALDEVLTRHEAAAGELLVTVLAHATFVKTQLGELDRAIELGERARRTDPNHPAAAYALGRAYAQKGDLENAKKALDQAVRAAESRDNFFEPLLRAELAAVQSRSGDLDNAIRNGERVLEFDPRNQRARFGLATVYIKDNKHKQALTIMRKALDPDPAWEREHLAPTDYPTWSADLIPGADAFAAAKVPAEDESLRLSSEGMLRFHAGQRDQAEKLFLQALKVDTYNHAALLYLGVLELERGRSAEPRARLKVALETTGGSHPVTQLYMARAEAAAGDVEAARKRLADLAESEPTLLQARYSLAMVLRQQKLEAEATEQLKSVVQQDPDYTPAKQALAEKI